MTSVSIQSPLKSEVFSSYDTLSPPPTPIAKRSRYFIPSNASAHPMPMLLPANQSLLGSSAARRAEPPLTTSSYTNEEAMARMHLESIASRPAPTLILMRRPRIEADTSRDNRDLNNIIQVDTLPPLPFSFPKDSFDFKSIESAIPQVPSQSSSNKSGSSNSLGSNEKKPDAVASAKHQVKLPSFQRSGMQRRAANRRNSYVARSA
eukprot:CAMPEP_0183713004 /NCGR_PEP_ID=MMETSP0737-20130205/8016_1 /TAXON_ID=385413 /ORGANISM="Thalassiosira miniscula, Strain CCMP1093" /LENGTH=205 /DNA_ID=CAMNT_0025941751 /DNA_START=229 /DNA_END=846 /DNA_ORIENTATION=+